MGKRYCCDYCDKTFPNSAENRKKHIQGVQHQKLRKLHYDSYRDAATVLKEESAKNPCRRFQQLGNCEYGPGCKYSHLTMKDVHWLQEQAKLDEAARRQPKLRNHAELDINIWLEKRSKKQDKKSKKSDKSDVATPKCNLPPELANVSTIPPSLFPARVDDCLQTEKALWG